jgi:serine/threonine protein kinase
MGEVYRARDLNLAREVAIKVLPTGVSWDAERRRRFDDEARAVAALNHPNILVVYQMGSYQGVSYLVSELLEGETLRQQISRGRLGVRKAIDYGGQIARGLAAAHQRGVVHRDLKPENLFLTKDGHLKILDFGLAKMTHARPGAAEEAPTETVATERGLVMGTVGYMSPEQVRAQETSHRTDIFSFGAVLYEMLTGRRAFQKQTAAETMSAILNEEPQEVSQLTPNLPPGLRRIVDRCLENKVEQRFQSASDLAFALDALSAVSESIGPAKSSAKVSAWNRRNAAVWVFALAMVAGVLFWWLVPSAAPQVTGVSQLTNDAVNKMSLLEDGTRLYFSEGEYDRLRLMQVSQAGGETAAIATGISNPLTLAIAPDASGLLLGAFIAPQTQIWWLPLPAGAPRALGDLKTNVSACFFPDGQHFAYADEKGIRRPIATDRTRGLWPRSRVFPGFLPFPQMADASASRCWIRARHRAHFGSWMFPAVRCTKC